MSESNGKTRPALTPVNFIPLSEAAKMAGTKSNILRKHRTAGWEKAGKAHKDPKGFWWIDPDLVPTIKPIQTRVARSPVPPAADERGTRGQGDKGTDLFLSPPHPVTPSPCHHPSPESAIAAAIAGTGDAGLSTTTPACNEMCLAAAIRNLLALQPIPWPLIERMVKMALAEKKGDRSTNRTN